MQTKIRSGAFALCLLALAVGVSQAGAQVPSLAGHWEGAIIVPEEELGINVDLVLADDGSWSGDISIPIQQTEDFPLAEISVVGTAVSFVMSGVPGEPTFTGTVSEDGRTIIGTFSQGGEELEFRLTKADG